MFQWKVKSEKLKLDNGRHKDTEKMASLKMGRTF